MCISPCGVDEAPTKGESTNDLQCLLEGRVDILIRDGAKSGVCGFMIKTINKEAFAKIKVGNEHH